MVSASTALLLLGAHVAHGFYLPGVAVREYQADERVGIKVNKLTSTKTQLPYDYYTLPFCKPEAITNAVENLGEVLHGSVIQNSPYDIFMGKSDFKVACRVELGVPRVALRAARATAGAGKETRWCAWRRKGEGACASQALTEGKRRRV